MKFKLDENLSPKLSAHFVSAGHEAHSANIQCYPPASYCGIMVLRLGTQAQGPVASALTNAIDVLQREALNGRLWIVELGRVRIHE